MNTNNHTPNTFSTPLLQLLMPICQVLLFILFYCIYDIIILPLVSFIAESTEEEIPPLTLDALLEAASERTMATLRKLLPHIVRAAREVEDISDESVFEYIIICVHPCVFRSVWSDQN